MERKIRKDEEYAVLIAVELRRQAALQQYLDQSDPQLLDRLAQYHSPGWRVNVVGNAKAICGDPDCEFTPWDLDADAYYYLRIFG